MAQYRPPRYAWRNLPPGSVPEMFRDEEDENAYYDHLAMIEYNTSTRRQFVLNLSRRALNQPQAVRAVSLEKLLWELPGLGGSTTLPAKGEKEVNESLGNVARTVLVQCSGYKPLERNHRAIQSLLVARNKDPLCLFLARLLSVPNKSLSETSCSVLLSVIKSPGRSALRDMTSMDMGNMTRLLLLRIYNVFQPIEKNQEKKKSTKKNRMEESKNTSNCKDKCGSDQQVEQEDQENRKFNHESGLLKIAHSQGFHMLVLLFELTKVPKALPWIRHGIVQLVPVLLNALVPEGAHGILSNMYDKETGLLKTVVSSTYSKSCRDLDSFETLCRIITMLSKDDVSAKLMVDSDFVETWFWMLRERRTFGDGKGNGCSDGQLEDDEHQRRVVRSFFDVLWEWTDSKILLPRIVGILVEAMERGPGGGGGGGGGGQGNDNSNGEGKHDGTWVEDEFDVVVRRLHPSSDLAMQACGILWNFLSKERNVIDLEKCLLERGIVEKLSLIMLKSRDCGVLTCCAGALYNLVQTDNLTFHVSSQEGLVDHLKWVKSAKNAQELVDDQKDRLLGDPALRYRGAAVGQPSAGMAAGSLSVNTKVSDVIQILSMACNRVLKRLMGDEDEIW
jgi:hypothetical protein